MRSTRRIFLQIAAAGLIGGAAAAEGPGRERVERTPNRRLHFVQIDVFASRRLQGNQLAVFTDGRGLSDAEMQNIARARSTSRRPHLSFRARRQLSANRESRFASLHRTRRLPSVVIRPWVPRWFCTTD